MTIIRHTNNFSTTLASGISNSDTSMTLTTGTGLPSLSGGDGYYLTLEEGGDIEIVLVTAASGASITTMARGQQGTTGLAFTSSANVELRGTADAFDRKADGASSSTDNAIVRYDGATGKVLQNSSVTIDDSGNITTSGTVDGRDLSTDGTKLDGIEASADVTDEANVKSALDGMTTTSVTPASGDKILLLDASDSDNLKHALFSSFGSGLSDGDKGDITVSASGATWTIDNDVVTFGKIQNIATNRLLGRSTASSGDVEEITVGSGLSLSSGILTASGGAGTPGGANTEVQYNSSGSFAGNNAFTYNGSGKITLSDTVVCNGIGALTLPTGANTDRPTAVDGMIRYNTTLDRYEGSHNASFTGGQFLIDGDFSSTGVMQRTGANTYTTATVDVDDGGTGRTSATAYAVVCGGTTSTGALQSIASVGTSGQVLTSNGAGALPTFQNASGGVSDGDKGDITVSSSGTVWTVDLPSSATVATDDKVYVFDTSASNAKAHVTAQSIRDLRPANLTAFRARLSGNQTVSSNVVTKIALNTEDFDTGGMFDNATNYRFTPTIAGKYEFHAVVYGITTSNDGICNVFIYKNGVEVAKSFAQYSLTATLSQSTSLIIEMNGSTDYVEMFGQVTGTTIASSNTSFSGCLLEKN